jgi:hypothetical protein
VPWTRQALQLGSHGRWTGDRVEVSDDKQGYEIEVTLDSSNKVDVRLDANFKVISGKPMTTMTSMSSGPDVH